VGHDRWIGRMLRELLLQAVCVVEHGWQRFLAELSDHSAPGVPGKTHGPHGRSPSPPLRMSGAGATAVPRHCEACVIRSLRGCSQRLRLHGEMRALHAAPVAPMMPGHERCGIGGLSKLPVVEPKARAEGGLRHAIA
jgi:hypothetical protein